jgi:hypothetical protein
VRAAVSRTECAEPNRCHSPDCWNPGEVWPLCSNSGEPHDRKRVDARRAPGNQAVDDVDRRDIARLAYGFSGLVGGAAGHRLTAAAPVSGISDYDGHRTGAVAGDTARAVHLPGSRTIGANAFASLLTSWFSFVAGFSSRIHMGIPTGARVDTTCRRQINRVRGGARVRNACAYVARRVAVTTWHKNHGATASFHFRC